MAEGLPKVVAGGEVRHGMTPFDAEFVPAPDRSDLMAAHIILDVLGDEPKVFDAAALDWVAEVVARLATFVSAARRELIAEFLELYNDGWRDPSDPMMTPDTFDAALGPPTAQLMWTPSEAAKSIEIWFNNVPMFLGHSLFCIYSDDEAMTVVDCGMFG